MLGWGFIIQQLTNKLLAKGHYSRKEPFARWDTSMFGIKWVEDLVAQGKAEKILFDGYPNSYLLRANVLLETIKNGIPDHKGFTVVGDDYVMPGNWKGQVTLDLAFLKSLKADELIIVDAWDLS
jgi:hypothetical protein